MHSITHDSSLPMRNHWVVYDVRWTGCVVYAPLFIQLQHNRTHRFRSENKNLLSHSISLPLCLTLSLGVSVFFRSELKLKYGSTSRLCFTIDLEWNRLLLFVLCLHLLRALLTRQAASCFAHCVCLFVFIYVCLLSVYACLCVYM